MSSRDPAAGAMPRPEDSDDTLFRRLRALDADDPSVAEVRAAVRDELVTRHRSLAENVAQRFSGRGQGRDDLAQVATIGLINAVDRFEPDRGDFLAYAVPTVMGEVRRYFRDQTWSVRVPRRLKDLHQTISAGTAEMYQLLGRAPRPSELAAHLGLDVEDVHDGLEAAAAYQPLSTDVTPTGHSESFGEHLGGDDPELERVDYHESLQPLLDKLPARERRILVLRFYGNLTQSQIAQRLGISQMHVSRLLAATLRQLRDGLGNTPPPQL